MMVPVEPENATPCTTASLHAGVHDCFYQRYSAFDTIITGAFLTGYYYEVE